MQRVQRVDEEGGKHFLGLSNRQIEVVSELGVVEFCNKFCKCFSPLNYIVYPLQCNLWALL